MKRRTAQQQRARVQKALAVLLEKPAACVKQGAGSAACAKLQPMYLVRVTFTVLVSAVLGGCAVVSVASTAVGVASTAVGVAATGAELAVDAAVGTVKVVGGAASAIAPGGDAK